jgi:hypothetical protein
MKPEITRAKAHPQHPHQHPQARIITNYNLVFMCRVTMPEFLPPSAHSQLANDRESLLDVCAANPRMSFIDMCKLVGAQWKLRSKFARRCSMCVRVCCVSRRV